MQLARITGSIAFLSTAVLVLADLPAPTVGGSTNQGDDVSSILSRANPNAFDFRQLEELTAMEDGSIDTEDNGPENFLEDNMMETSSSLKASSFDSSDDSKSSDGSRSYGSYRKKTWTSKEACACACKIVAINNNVNVPVMMGGVNQQPILTPSNRPPVLTPSLRPPVNNIPVNNGQINQVPPVNGQTGALPVNGNPNNQLPPTGQVNQLPPNGQINPLPAVGQMQQLPPVNGQTNQFPPHNQQVIPLGTQSTTNGQIPPANGQLNQIPANQQAANTNVNNPLNVQRTNAIPPANQGRQTRSLQDASTTSTSNFSATPSQLTNSPVMTQVCGCVCKGIKGKKKKKSSYSS